MITLANKWSDKQAKAMKRHTLTTVIEAVGVSRELMDHWGKTRQGAKLDKVMDAVDTLWITGFRSGPDNTPSWTWDEIMQEWYAHDWRGKTGSPPTPEQLVEHCMRWRAKQLSLSKRWVLSSLSDDERQE